MKNVIYLITNTVNGKRYVGQTRKTVRGRWAEHRNRALATEGQSYSTRTAITRAMRKHGVSAFRVELLEECASPDDLDAREAHWIATLGTLVPAGYNLTEGGRTSRRSPDVAARISAANKGRVKTPEWRAKLSASHKGKIISAEQRAKISATQTGRKQPEETNRKRSETMKGRNSGPCSPERRAAIIAGMTPEGRQRTIEAARKALTGRKRGPHSEETKAKMRAAALGRSHTEETRAKISALQAGQVRGPYSHERIEKARAGLIARLVKDGKRDGNRPPN